MAWHDSYHASRGAASLADSGVRPRGMRIVSEFQFGSICAHLIAQALGFDAWVLSLWDPWSPDGRHRRGRWFRLPSFQEVFAHACGLFCWATLVQCYD